jgi:hypothetical protein
MFANKTKQPKEKTNGEFKRLEGRDAGREWL